MPRVSVINEYSLPHYSEREENNPITGVILHSCYASNHSNPFCIPAIVKLLDKNGVSCHYLLARCGRVYCLVDCTKKAWHAGKSFLPELELENLNDYTIGIELVATETSRYTPQQISSLISLIRDIYDRYKISFITSHAHIAPERKTDPWEFDWKVFKKLLRPEKVGLHIFH